MNKEETTLLTKVPFFTIENKERSIVFGQALIGGIVIGGEVVVILNNLILMGI